MFVQMICKDRNEKEMNELYEVLGLIARREEVHIEDRYDHVISWFVHKERLL